MSDAARPLAVVTGATAGIGLDFARQLAARGHDLLLVARDPDRLAACCQRLEADQPGLRAEPFTADLASHDGIDRLAHRLATTACAVLVHNAGFGTKGLLHRTDGDTQQRMVMLHVVACDRLVRATLPGMIARGHGALVVVSSVASWTASAGNVNYGATKAYQRAYMESLALELTGTGVHAQALCPGFTRTEFHERAAMNMSAIPGMLWMSSSDVVRASIEALDRGRPTVVVPGLRWRLIAFLLRHTPRALLRIGASRYRRTRT